MSVEDFVVFLVAPTSQIALIIGIAEAFKRAGANPKFIPIIDIILGLMSGIGVFGLLLGYGVGYGILIGIALGLSACGLFSGTKNVFEYIVDKLK